MCYPVKPADDRETSGCVWEMNNLYDALAAYVAVLSRSAQQSHRAEDRPVYTRHLAVAAQFFLAVHGGRIEELRSLVASERHAYGWGYLSNEEGAAAEKAFDDFARIVETDMA